MSRRIEERFAALAKAKRKGLITYVMAGDLNLKVSARIIAALPKAGADIIEIGIPFSDPMADGPTIQAAGLRALRSGTKLKAILKLIKTLRAKDTATPFILMGYYNPVYHYGLEQFCKDATSAGVDGIILVDLPPEEEEEFVSIAAPHDLKLIRLIAPTTDDKRLAMLSQNAGGFLYYISIAGITGTTSANAKSLNARVKHLKSKTRLPIAVGFGIKTPAQAAEAAKSADAVVVGSALVDILAKKSLMAAMHFVKSLRNAMDAG
jgi:tryptophan synthase alpha chain